MICDRFGMLLLDIGECDQICVCSKKIVLDLKLSFKLRSNRIYGTATVSSMYAPPDNYMILNI